MLLVINYRDYLIINIMYLIDTICNITFRSHLRHILLHLLCWLLIKMMALELFLMIFERPTTGYDRTLQKMQRFFCYKFVSIYSNIGDVMVGLWLPDNCNGK